MHISAKWSDLNTRKKEEKRRATLLLRCRGREK